MKKLLLLTLLCFSAIAVASEQSATPTQQTTTHPKYSDLPFGHGDGGPGFMIYSIYGTGLGAFCGFFNSEVGVVKGAAAGLAQLLFRNLGPEILRKFGVFNNSNKKLGDYQREELSRAAQEKCVNWAKAIGYVASGYALNSIKFPLLFGVLDTVIPIPLAMLCLQLMNVH